MLSVSNQQHGDSITVGLSALYRSVQSIIVDCVATLLACEVSLHAHGFTSVLVCPLEHVASMLAVKQLDLALMFRASFI
jgi:hypothetical protein